MTNEQPVRRWDRHEWSNLLFLHWRVPKEVLQPLVPPALQLDTWENETWLGMVLFELHGVRPWWLPPPVPRFNFFETNIRTYVNHPSHGPGVWFFSLDASSRAAVLTARWLWHLPYYYSQMSVQRRPHLVEYGSRRLPGQWRDRHGGSVDVASQIGLPICAATSRTVDAPSHISVPKDSLEYYLGERYVLYSRDQRGRLYVGRVHHDPYPFRQAKVTRTVQTLTDAIGMPLPSPPDHAMFADRVAVDIDPLRAI